jgi:ATP-dependent helicase/nuclease subunit B
MNPSVSVRLVPPQSDFAAVLAAAVIQGHRNALPDLSGLTILVPTAGAIPALRRQIARLAGGALLGPQICTLQQFAAEHGSARSPLGAAECRLVLVDALRRHRRLFPDQDPWHLADALFALFEELSAHAVELPQSGDPFAARLARAYRARPLAALSQEAYVVHTLWHAFLEDIEARSPAASYAANLLSACARIADGIDAPPTLLFAGFDALSAVECAAAQAAAACCAVEFWVHGRAIGRDGAAIAALCRQLGVETAPAEAAQPTFLGAALGLPEDPPPAPPGAPALRITVAADCEHEARCVDLAVREALLGGARDIAVVTEDRRLARRLRALLERADVELRDDVGWALSTSAAAALCNTWLEAVERHFQFRPLLTLLKSGLFDADADTLRVLERDLVYGQSLESGLNAFRAKAEAHPRLAALLERLADAARLMPATGQPRAAQDWLRGLESSLRALGVWSRWQQDEAGRRLTQVLRELGGALSRRPQTVNWREFRSWLDRAIEGATFVPPRPAPAAARVRLLTLEQSALLRCDALVLAGATRAQIPGAPAGEPFFNQSVRAELGLPDFERRHALALSRLRRLLEAAPLVRVTYAPGAAGEPAQLCPWIEAIESLAAAQGFGLRDAGLAVRAGTAATEVSRPAPPPPLRHARPQPPAPVPLLPERLSSGVHQSLIDCPYQFFAAYCLGLRAAQAPDEDPDRSDYGQRVHRILEAFTQPVAGLPAPFGGVLDAASRAEAAAKLEELAQAVFAPDLRSRALAHLWLTEFRAGIPALVDWLRDRGGRPARAEVSRARPFGARHALVGKADRVEEFADGTEAVIDFKTGRAPRVGEVYSGEAVQLLHYAMLDERVTWVEYLPLGEDSRPLKFVDDLTGLRDAAGGRLFEVLDALAGAAPLPAFGDSASCQRCDFRGLCRRDDWHG